MMRGFPIFRLPHKPLRLLLKTMEVQDLVRISFYSKTAKHAVESLNMKLIYFYITISGTIQFDIFTYNMEDLNLKLSVTQSEGRNLIRVHGEKVMTGISLREFIDQILTIFHQATIHKLFIKHIDYDYLEEFNNLNIQLLHLATRSSLKHFARRFDFLTLEQITWETRDFQSLVGLNFKHLETRSTFKLEDLLVSNTSQILIHEPLPLTDLCIFLKHWINGSTERLELFHMRLPQNFQKEEFIQNALSGIKYKKLDVDQKLEFEAAVDVWKDSHREVKNEGFGIQRSDGTYAIIVVCDEFATNKYLKMFVWKPIDSSIGDLLKIASF